MSDGNGRKCNPANAVADLLSECGALRLISRGHIKWRLPNGRTFVVSTSPSDHRAVQNQYSLLKRLLRETSSAV